MPTRREALDFLENSRESVPVVDETVRVENFRRQNLSLKLLSPDLGSDDLLAILQVVDQFDQLPPDTPFPVREL